MSSMSILVTYITKGLAEGKAVMAYVRCELQRRGLACTSVDHFYPYSSTLSTASAPPSISCLHRCRAALFSAGVCNRSFARSCLHRPFSRISVSAAARALVRFGLLLAISAGDSSMTASSRSGQQQAASPFDQSPRWTVSTQVPDGHAQELTAVPLSGVLVMTPALQ